MTNDSEISDEDIQAEFNLTIAEELDQTTKANDTLNNIFALLESLAAQETWREDSYFDQLLHDPPFDIYNAGVQDGKTELSRYLLEKYKGDKIND